MTQKKTDWGKVAKVATAAFTIIGALVKKK